MAKNKGKKHKNKIKGKMIAQQSKKKNAKPALAGSAGPSASDHESTGNSGFIFMCSPSTKVECYQYRVFGLPSGMKQVVEGIMPGAKLFLFDFQLKLLYGIYEATSAGMMNLEPDAFAGRFPAQVQFRIFKECLPLHESSLRLIIRENYTGSKFKQELSSAQVEKLLSSFRPLTASSSQLALQNESLYSRSVPFSSTRHHQFTGRLPSMEVPCLGEIRRSHIPPFLEPQHVSNVNALPHGYHRASAYVERMNPVLDIQRLTAAISHYVGNSQQPTFIKGAPHGVQDPSSYSRAIEERPPHDQATGLERRYLPAEDGVSHDQVTNPERRYVDIAKNQVTDFERRFHQQLPPNRGDAIVYQDNPAAYNPAAPALYNNPATSSVIQAQQQTHTPYHGDAQYQDNNAVRYNYDPSVAALSSSEYTASSAQVSNAAAPAYNTYSAAPAYNTYSAAPAYNTYSAAPAYNTYSAAPAYNTYSAAPAYNTYSAAPAYNTYSAAPVYNTYSAAPAYNSYPTAPSSSEYTAPSSLYQDTNAVVYNPSTQYSIEASGVYGNNETAVAYAPPTADAPSAAQPQVSNYYYSYDSTNHVSYQP